MKPEVYLDSGIFIAFLNRRDRWHTEAVALFGEPPRAWSTSLPVVAETYGWFLHRAGEEAARAFRQFLEALPGLQWLGADPAGQHRMAVANLEKFRGAKLSYVDALSLGLIRQHRIKTVWATDHHLGLAGVTLLPRT